MEDEKKNPVKKKKNLQRKMQRMRKKLAPPSESAKIDIDLKTKPAVSRIPEDPDKPWVIISFE